MSLEAGAHVNREALDAPAMAPDLRSLVNRIRLHLKPDSIGLLGDTQAGSKEWELLVAIPEDADPDLHDPILCWLIQQEAGVPATIRTMTSASAGTWESLGAPTTIWSAKALVPSAA
ncbi:MAG: hypothetical protein JNL61_06600 [Rhizobiaceae bacterium]|nr:hypothetical protein [Rhizobiaceae bacterium]